MSKNVKKRNWAFVLYPESAVDGWKQVLTDTGLPCCISPLHDKDVNPTGELKKPHWHIILCYAGPTSYNVVSSLTESINGTIPQPLEQVRGYFRYLTHKDNPEKFQYSESDIESLNGFNISDYCELTRSEIVQIKARVQSLIRESDIVEYSALCDILLDSGMLTEYEVVASNTLFFNTYLTSRRNSVHGSHHGDDVQSDS